MKRRPSRLVERERGVDYSILHVDSLMRRTTHFVRDAPTCYSAIIASDIAAHPDSAYSLSNIHDAPDTFAPLPIVKPNLSVALETMVITDKMYWILMRMTTSDSYVVSLALINRRRSSREKGEEAKTADIVGEVYDVHCCRRRRAHNSRSRENEIVPFASLRRVRHAVLV